MKAMAELDDYLQSAIGIQSSVKAKTTAFFHQPDGAVFGIAGIFSVQAGNSCGMVTTGFPIHDRMPLVLSPGDYARWLDPHTPLEELRTMLIPTPDDVLMAEPENPPLQQKEAGLFD